MRMWTCVKRPGWKAGIIDDPDGNTIAEVYNRQEAKARELVRMANSHKHLLEACQAFVDYYDQEGIGACLQGHDDEESENENDGFDGDERFNVRQARAAIAKATPRE